MIYLIDIDGTLLLAGGAGSAAIDQAFSELHGVAQAMRGVRPAGKTDPLIVAEAFRARVGRAPTRAEVKRLLARYLELLPDTVRRSQGFRLLRGVPHGLDRLATRGHLLGLGTGNLRRGARIKLERAQLWARFSFGGFGDDGETRVDLIRLAAERGARLQDRPLVPAEVVVVGDTPLDVDAARQNGFRAVAVASKPGSRRALERCGAERVIDGLEEL